MRERDRESNASMEESGLPSLPDLPSQRCTREWNLPLRLALPPLTGASSISHAPLCASSLLEPGSLQASGVTAFKQTGTLQKPVSRLFYLLCMSPLHSDTEARGPGGELGSLVLGPVSGESREFLPFTDFCCQFPFLRGFFKLPVPDSHRLSPVRFFPCRYAWLLRSSLYMEQSEKRGQR